MTSMDNWLLQIRDNERKIYSQSGQDGVIDFIFQHIKPVNNPPFCIEFGFSSPSLTEGSGANVGNLILNKKWEGLLLDGGFENEEINLHQEFITSGNICSLFEKYNVPISPDYISIDIDSCDLWVFKAIIEKYKPQVVSIEYNANFDLETAITFPDNPNENWRDNDRVYGASLKALKMVGEEFGYSLVHAVSPLDAFFIRGDLIENLSPQPYEEYRKDTGIPINLGCTSGRDQIMLDYEVFVKTGIEAKALEAANPVCAKVLT